MHISHIIRRLKKNQLFKDSSWALIGSVLGKGLSLIAGIVVARFLGKEIYGEYGMIKNTLFQIAVFSTFGLGYTGTRYIAKYLESDQGIVRAYIRVIYIITLVASSFLAIFTFIFSRQIANYLEVPETANAFRITALIIIINAVNTSQIGILSGFKDFKEIAKNNTFGGLMTFVTSFALTYFWELYGALVALLVSMVFNAILNCISISRRTKILPSVKSIERASYTGIIKFSIPIALQESLYSIVSWGISVMVIKLSDYGQLGLLQAAAQWASIVLFIPGVLKNVILSYFSSTSDTVSMRRRMLAINFCATIFPFVAISILSRWISTFYGNSFSDLPPVLMISCFNSVFSSMAGVILYELISQGKTWLSFLFRLMRDVTILCLDYVLLFYRPFEVQSSLLVVAAQCSVGLVFVLCLLVFIKQMDRKQIV